MDFGRAFATTFTIASGRQLKEGEVDETEQIGWGYGFTGIAILIVAQLGLIFWAASQGASGDLLLNLSIVAFTPLVVPFVLFWLTAVITGTTNRLPASFFYVGIVLAILQVVSSILASFGTGSGGFVIGILFAVTFLAAKGFLKIHWGAAIVIGLLVVAGFIGANFLLLMLIK